MAKKLKAAIVGLGKVGLLFDEEQKRQTPKEIYTHVSAYQALADFYEVVAVVDPDASRFAAAKRRIPEVSCYGTLEEMISKEQVDVVSICTPDPMHLPCLEKVLGKVRGVFMEKPVCGFGELSLAGELVTEMKRKRMSVRVNYYKTTEPLWQKALRFHGACDPFYVSVKYSGPFDAVGSHALNLLVALTSNLEIVKGIRFVHEEGDGISGVFQFGGKNLAELIYCGPRHRLIFECDILSGKGRASLKENLAALELFEYQESKRYQGYSEIEQVAHERVSGNPDRFLGFLKEIYGEILTGQTCYGNLDQAIATQELMQRLAEEAHE